MRWAFYRRGSTIAIGLEDNDCDLFGTINSFMLLSVYATIHHILERWVEGPYSTTRSGDASYRAIEPNKLLGIFQAKKKTWEV